MLKKTRFQLLIMFVAMTMLNTMAFARDGRSHAGLDYLFLKKTDFKLEQAVQTLKPKGKVIAARLKRKNDVQYYKLDQIEGDKVMEILVDPSTKKIAKTSQEGMFSRYSEKEERLAASKAKISLLDAMEIAKKQYNAVVISASFADRDHQSHYRINLATDQGSFSALVDANSGDTFRMSLASKRGHRESDHHRFK